MRECGGCSECCKGWLRGEAHGHPFWPGRQCKFCTGSGCEIYETRPDNPCKSFRCAWLADEQIPAWMRPDKCGAIVTYQKLKEHEYVDIVECGKKLDSSILSWFFMAYAAGHVKNLCYMVDGGKNWIGTKEFIKAVEGK